MTGPLSLITAAVSSDLVCEHMCLAEVVLKKFLFAQGTHKSLKNNQNAKATVAGIINGTGSFGAAFGPFIAGWVTNNWVSVYNLWFVMSG